MVSGQREKIGEKDSAFAGPEREMPMGIPPEK